MTVTSRLGPDCSTAWEISIAARLSAAGPSRVAMSRELLRAGLLDNVVDPVPPAAIRSRKTSAIRAWCIFRAPA